MNECYEGHICINHLAEAIGTYRNDVWNVIKRHDPEIPTTKPYGKVPGHNRARHYVTLENAKIIEDQYPILQD